MNRVERRRESKLKRIQNLDLEALRNNEPQALQAALQAIDANVREQRLTKARKICESALSACPQSSPLNYALGVVYQAKGDVTDAVHAYQKAVSLSPENQAAWINLGICARAMKSFDTALTAFDKAIELNADSFHAHYNRALVHCDLKQFDHAVVALENALTLEPNSSDAQFQLGFLHELKKNHADAITSYRKVVSADPGTALAHTHLGACLQMVGQFDQAAEHLRKAIELNPFDGRAHFLLASSAQAPDDPAFLSNLEKQIVQPGLPAPAKINMQFAAGRLHERAHDYDRAFAHYKAGNEQRNMAYQYDRSEMASLGDRIETVFTPAYIAKFQAAGNSSKRPVFVVGMPRSGTTLVEQIIASHPQAYGAEELSNLMTVCTVPGMEAGPEYPEYMADLTSEQISQMAENYLAAYPDGATDAIKVVDKTPGNALWLGIIALMFPNATIIHCDRDPIDTCWSCYSQNFFSDVIYACDFDNLATYHALHSRAMAHWRSMFPGKIVDIRYEDLVANPEAVIPQIIAACGLDWDDRCMAFHQHQRSVNTTSLWQVRQPLFTSSVSKWKKFEAHLAPLIAALG